MTALIQDSDKRKGVLATIIFHIILAIIFILFGLKQPNPIPEDIGIDLMMADYGYTETGSGEVESESTEQVQETPQPEPSQSQPATPAVSEEVATQEESEVAVPEPTEQPVEEAPAEPTLSPELQNILNAMNQPSGGGSEGSTQGEGNEGVQTGNPEGMGTMDLGDGISYSLGGRGHLKGPDVVKEHKEEGKVVLNIYVDRNGKVIRTSPHLAGSTTTSQALFNLASKMAKSARFKSDANAPPEQKGQMTFVFVLE